MNKRWKVILAFLAVFIAGAICGRPVINRLMEPPRLSMMDRLSKQLSLSPSEEEKIRPIVLQAQQEMQRLRRENMKAVLEVMDRTHVALAAELSPEQRAKLAVMRKRLQERLEKIRAAHNLVPAN